MAPHEIHIHLIPISIPNQPPPGPDPPDHVYHDTTDLKLRQIIDSGCIKPTRAKIEPHEKHVAWFSTNPEWDPTATKVPLPGMAGQIETAEAPGGLVRIAVPGASAPYVFPRFPLIAGIKPSVCIGLPLTGLERGGDPDTWRFTATPVPAVLFREVEFYDFSCDRWVAVDMAELARRN